MPDVPLGETCFDDTDCDDGAYCNGVERCLPVSPDSELRVCMTREKGPCGTNTCDEIKDECHCVHPDFDNDGFAVEGCPNGRPFDCDDEDASRSPGRAEICDFGHDEDCDDKTLFTIGQDRDVDKDGFVDGACANELEYQPSFSAEARLLRRGNDCDDARDDVHPNAREVCDGLDNDCDNTVDESFPSPRSDSVQYYADRDRDGAGNPDEFVWSLCGVPPEGFTVVAGDCKDDDPDVNDKREEICNGKDDDCDGEVDRPRAAGTLMFDEPFDGVTDFECKGEAGWAVERCPPGRLNCGDESYLDACETLGTSLCNCGACGRSCDFSCGAVGCETIQSITTGFIHTCAVFGAPSAESERSVACWGGNMDGQLGLGTTQDTLVPTRIEGLRGVTALSAGDAHTCAVFSGTPYCWGRNDQGQLGNRTPASFSALPIKVFDVPGLDTPVTALSAGANHTCAIYSGGEVACWGSGSAGQLGSGSEGDEHISVVPVHVQRESTQLSVTDASHIVAGLFHTCALVANEVLCWGQNHSGQLGIDPNVLPSSSMAVVVPGLEDLVIDELSAAGDHTCARAGAEVFCWGSNFDNELALPDVEWSPPTRIPLAADATAVATGLFFACALSSGGEVECWGSNAYGETGENPGTPTAVPSKLDLSGIIALGGGNGLHLCAVTLQGTRCWGANDRGQLGDGEPSGEEPRPLPRPVLLPLAGELSCAP